MVLFAASSAVADPLAAREHLFDEHLELDTSLYDLPPSMFDTEQLVQGWRAGELSYDVGLFRIGVSAAMTHDGDLEQRRIGLFAYRTFRLSRWMHAWVMLGIAFEQTQIGPGARQGVTTGLWLGTTFR